MVLDVRDMDEDVFYSLTDSGTSILKDEVRRDSMVKGKRCTTLICALQAILYPWRAEALPALKEILIPSDSLHITDGLTPFIFHPPNLCS